MSFVAPKHTGLTPVPGHVTIGNFGLGSGDPSTLDGQLNAAIETLQTNYPTFNVVDSSVNATLSGNPAYRMEYTFSLDETTDVKGIEYGTIIGDIVYYAYFEALEYEYPEYLPTAESILSSIKIDPASPFGEGVAENTNPRIGNSTTFPTKPVIELYTCMDHRPHPCSYTGKRGHKRAVIEIHSSNGRGNQQMVNPAQRI